MGCRGNSWAIRGLKGLLGAIEAIGAFPAIGAYRELYGF